MNYSEICKYIMHDGAPLIGDKQSPALTALATDPDMIIAYGSRDTAINIAIQFSKTHAVAWVCELLRLGANPEHLNGNKVTTIFIACVKDNVEAARLLLETKRVNVNGTEVINPLLTAIQHKNYDMCKLLIDHGATVNHSTKHNNHLSQALTFPGDDLKILELVLGQIPKGTLTRANFDHINFAFKFRDQRDAARALTMMAEHTPHP